VRITIEIQDAGRAESGIKKEKSDCTVRAIATGMEIPYREAHQTLKALGRRNGSGTVVHRGWLDKHPYATRMTVTGGYTLRQLLEDHPTGTFLVSVPRHILTVVDGVIYDSHFDSKYLYCQMEHLWRIGFNPDKLNPVKFRVKT
jgi:hypothetical protein